MFRMFRISSSCLLAANLPSTRGLVVPGVMPPPLQTKTKQAAAALRRRVRAKAARPQRPPEDSRRSGRVVPLGPPARERHLRRTRSPRLFCQRSPFLSRHLFVCFRCQKSPFLSRPFLCVSGARKARSYRDTFLCVSRVRKARSYRDAFWCVSGAREARS